MSYHFNRDVYFDAVRDSLFAGRLTQQQVDGQNFILDVWEQHLASWDLRWLGYPLATTIHETASTMWPIEEYGKGKGQEYGKSDPETGLTYYGRGFVQLTWKDNYKKMTTPVREFFPGEDIDLVWHPEQALVPKYAAIIMFYGMMNGDFRAGHKLAKYFSEVEDDDFNAREIINGDKNTVPSWSGGKTIGKLVQGYHQNFMDALDASWIDDEPAAKKVIVNIQADPSVKVICYVNGEECKV